MAVAKDLLKVSGGMHVVEWEKTFGMGLYGALLSVGAGILILAYPNLVSTIAGLYLFFRGLMEAFKYSKRKAFEKAMKK